MQPADLKLNLRESETCSPSIETQLSNQISLSESNLKSKTKNYTAYISPIKPQLEIVSFIFIVLL